MNTGSIQLPDAGGPEVQADNLDFEKSWYVVRSGVVDQERQRVLHDYALTRERENSLAFGDDQVSAAAFAYSDPLIDRLLEDVRSEVGRVAGCSLWPTFSYMRVYRSGNVLPAHRDRPACEISMTVNLGIDAAKPWPIWISGPGGIEAVELDPGDGLIYRGCDCYHWREPFEGAHLVQAFLHYVDQHGPNAHWKFDKREQLAFQKSPSG